MHMKRTILTYEILLDNERSELTREPPNQTMHCFRVNLFNHRYGTYLAHRSSIRQDIKSVPLSTCMSQVQGLQRKRLQVTSARVCCNFQAIEASWRYHFQNPAAWSWHGRFIIGLISSGSIAHRGAYGAAY